MKLLLENVRSFAGRHEIPIRPLTLMVGENSTGKTTAMVMLAASARLFAPARLDFNTEPYALGNFDTIATYSIAPIRSKPKRTHDEINDEFEPEGDHIPAIFARHPIYPFRCTRSGSVKSRGILSRCLCAERLAHLAICVMSATELVSHSP